MRNHTFYNAKRHLLQCKTIPFTTQNATFHHAKPYLLQHISIVANPNFIEWISYFNFVAWNLL